MNKTQIRNSKKADLLDHLGIDDPTGEWKRDELVDLALRERDEAEATLASEKTDEEEERDAVQEEEEGDGTEEVGPPPWDDGSSEEPSHGESPVSRGEAEDLTDPVNQHGHRLNEYARRVWNGQGSMPASERVRRVIRALRAQGFTDEQITDHLSLPTDLSPARYMESAR